MVFTVKVELPVPGTEVGEKVPVVRAGSPETLNTTVPVKPPEGVTVAVNVVLAPRETVRLVGEAPMEKSPTGAGFTVSDTVVEWTRVPLVPVMVTVNVPVAVVLLVVTVMVDEPEPVTVVGINEAVAFAGNPLALKVTTPLNPFCAVMVAV